MVEQDIALTDWLKPFVEKLGHKKRRQMCPVYISGLIGPGDRKSIEPMAERLAPDHYDRLHHFISDGIWDAGPLETELAVQADRIVGASDAFLVIDDTGLPKKGDHSVGVAPQYASMLGKRANCQTLVSLTLARDEVPVPVGLRLFLPESWTSNQDRMVKAGVPEEMRLPAHPDPKEAGSSQRLQPAHDPQQRIHVAIPVDDHASAVQTHDFHALVRRRHRNVRRNRRSAACHW